MATGTKPAELRELSDPELVERLREAKAELFNLRVQAATGQLDNNRRLQVVRREIAQRRNHRRGAGFRHFEKHQLLGVEKEHGRAQSQSPEKPRGTRRISRVTCVMSRWPQKAIDLSSSVWITSSAFVTPASPIAPSP